MSAADFFLVVHDCVTGPDGRPTETEIFGYYRTLHQDDRDTLQTAFISVPPGSPIALMAHQVSADPDGTLTRAADLMLRASIARCPCTARAECPALSDISLLAALEHATSTTMPRRKEAKGDPPDVGVTGKGPA